MEQIINSVCLSDFCPHSHGRISWLFLLKVAQR